MSQEIDKRPSTVTNSTSSKNDLVEVGGHGSSTTKSNSSSARLKQKYLDSKSDKDFATWKRLEAREAAKRVKARNTPEEIAMIEDFKKFCRELDEAESSGSEEDESGSDSDSESEAKSLTEDDAMEYYFETCKVLSKMGTDLQKIGRGDLLAEFTKTKAFQHLVDISASIREWKEYQAMGKPWHGKDNFALSEAI